MRYLAIILLHLLFGFFFAGLFAGDNPKPCMVQILDSPWPKNNKLLILGIQLVTARGDDGNYEWSYLPDGPVHATFKDNNGHNYRRPNMTTQDFPSTTIDVDKVQVKLTKSDGRVCKDLKTLNLTYPRYFAFEASQDNLPPPVGQPPPPPNKSTSIVRETRFGQGSPVNAVILDEFVKYNINDQFSATILDSDRGGKNVQTKETVSISPKLGTRYSPPATQPTFKTNNDGFQSDQLRIVAILSSFKIPGTNLFNPALAGQVVATFNETHDWYSAVSVGNHPTQTTANTLSVSVTSVTNGNRNITITTTYTVVPK